MIVIPDRLFIEDPDRLFSSEDLIVLQNKRAATSRHLGKILAFEKYKGKHSQPKLTRISKIKNTASHILSELHNYGQVLDDAIPLKKRLLVLLAGSTAAVGAIAGYNKLTGTELHGAAYNHEIPESAPIDTEHYFYKT